MLSKCAICGSRKSKFIKKQEAKGLLSNLGIRTPLSKIPVLGDIFFLNAILSHEIPLNAIPLNAIPLDAIPLDAIPLDAIPLKK